MSHNARAKLQGVSTHLQPGDDINYQVANGQNLPASLHSLVWIAKTGLIWVALSDTASAYALHRALWSVTFNILLHIKSSNTTSSDITNLEIRSKNLVSLKKIQNYSPHIFEYFYTELFGSPAPACLQKERQTSVKQMDFLFCSFKRGRLYFRFEFRNTTFSYWLNVYLMAS